MPNHMFTGASIGTISGGTFVNHSEKSALEKLTAATAHSALHDAPARTDETRCHQRTRMSVLDHLERWAQGICDEGASVFWLHGGAGAGKSAIMQTLAERFVAQSLALGSFFFFRSDPTRNAAEVLIPTLVYQLAQLFPPVIQFLDPIIDGDPLIFKKSFQVQILRLFIPALQHLTQLGVINDTPQSQRIFLIDGLDECSDTVQQQAIIHVVAGVCHEYRIPVKFLIASRAEHAISASFELFSRENRELAAISLSEDPDAEEDIQQFIEDEFLKVRLQHPFRKMIPLEWPNFDDIDSLVQKSSSHFIYASTVMRYIWSAKENPVRSLQVILGVEMSRTVSPFAELDALYHHILESAAHRDRVLQIIAHCIYMIWLPSSTRILCSMFTCSENDLVIYTADVIPLLVICQSPFSLEEEVKLLHASLEDFLQDQSRSRSLYVNKKIYRASTLERCFQLFDICSRQQHSAMNFVVSDYAALTTEILYTIEISGHLLEIEEVLQRNSLRDFYQCQLRFKQYNPRLNLFHRDLSEFLTVVHRMKTPNATKLSKGFAEDFFDILESYINLESMSLAPAIVTLACCGYPAQVVRRIVRHLFFLQPFYELLSYEMPIHEGIKPGSVLDIIAMAAPASVHYSVNTSPKRLALAAEAILEYLTDQVFPSLQLLSTDSTHKSWLQRTKPGKHIATGTPTRASVIHTLCLTALHQISDPDEAYSFQASHKLTWRLDLQTISMILGSKYGHSPDALWLQKDKTEMVVDLLEALLWLLPKAGFSEKIILYSKRMLPQSMYQRKTALIRRVRRCLDRYTTRVQNAKLDEFHSRMDSGDVSALIERSRMFYLNAQD